MYLNDKELAERYDADAADCERWAREAREEYKKKIACAVTEAELDAANFWRKKAGMWAEQAKALRESAKALRAWTGEKPVVGIKGRGARGGKSRPPRML